MTHVLIGILSGIGLTLLLSRFVRGFRKPGPANEIGAVPQRTETAKPTSDTRQARPVDEPVLAALRQNLRVKVGYDEAKIDRLIDLERQRLPGSLRKLMEAAIESWERDNR